MARPDGPEAAPQALLPTHLLDPSSDTGFANSGGYLQPGGRSGGGPVQGLGSSTVVVVVLPAVVVVVGAVVVVVAGAVVVVVGAAVVVVVGGAVVVVRAGVLVVPAVIVVAGGADVVVTGAVVPATGCVTAGDPAGAGRSGAVPPVVVVDAVVVVRTSDAAPKPLGAGSLASGSWPRAATAAKATRMTSITTTRDSGMSWRRRRDRRGARSRRMRGWPGRPGCHPLKIATAPTPKINRETRRLKTSGSQPLNIATNPAPRSKAAMMAVEASGFFLNIMSSTTNWRPTRCGPSHPPASPIQPPRAGARVHIQQSQSASICYRGSPNGGGVCRPAGSGMEASTEPR